MIKVFIPSVANKNIPLALIFLLIRDEGAIEMSEIPDLTYKFRNESGFSIEIDGLIIDSLKSKLDSSNIVYEIVTKKPTPIDPAP